MTDRKSQRVNPLEACSAEKKRYDSCFKEWYKGKFLKGEIETSTECDEKFEELQVCINQVLDKARFPQGEKR